MSRSVPEWKGKTDDDKIPDRVKLRRLIEDSSIPEPNSGCWLWNKDAYSTGYGRFYDRELKGRQQLLAHRVSYEANIGPLSRRDCICHKCDNPICVNPDHLFKGTHADNMRDCSAKGRAKVPRLMGSDHPQSKLQDNDIIAIRRDRRSLRLIAKEYQVSRASISNIKAKKLGGTYEKGA